MAAVNVTFRTPTEVCQYPLNKIDPGAEAKLIDLWRDAQDQMLPGYPVALLKVLQEDGTSKAYVYDAHYLFKNHPAIFNNGPAIKAPRAPYNRAGTVQALFFFVLDTYLGLERKQPTEIQALRVSTTNQEHLSTLFQALNPYRRTLSSPVLSSVKVLLQDNKAAMAQEELLDLGLEKIFYSDEPLTETTKTWTLCRRAFVKQIKDSSAVAEQELLVAEDVLARAEQGAAEEVGASFALMNFGAKNPEGKGQEGKDPGRRTA